MGLASSDLRHLGMRDAGFVLLLRHIADSEIRRGNMAQNCEFNPKSEQEGRERRSFPSP